IPSDFARAAGLLLRLLYCHVGKASRILPVRPFKEGAMLVVSRKPGESVIIGEDIVVTVSKISGRKVRLAIAAPRSVAIRRSELPEDFSATEHAAAQKERRLHLDYAAWS